MREADTRQGEEGRQVGGECRTVGLVLTKLLGLQDFFYQEKATSACFYFLFFVPKQHELVFSEIFKKYFCGFFFN